MKQKIIKLLIAIAGLLVSANANAYDFSKDGIYYNITSETDRTVEVTYKLYNKSTNTYSNDFTGNLTIPTKLIYNSRTYTVTSIGSNAFEYCDGLTSVTIGNSVTSIGNEAFYSCKGLTEVTIPNSVTSIGIYAFYGCSRLTEVTIPNSVTSIGKYAFSGCSGLTSVTIQNEQLEIGDGAFDVCNGLNKVNISDIKAWCDIYFHSCTSNPLYYAKNLYLNDTKITDLVIPNSVTSIGEHAFYGCSGLTSVTIPNSVTTIGNSAFEYCTGLTSITIPNSVTSIRSYAFSSCTGLTSVTIPNSVTSIRSYAFSSCTGLTSVTIPNSVTTIDWYAFSYCTGLTSITIPNSVTSIGSYAFSGCSGLTSVTIPNSVTSIGEYAFYGCNGLNKVNISDIKAWCNINFDKSTSNPLYYAKNLYLNDTKITDLVIPNSVTSIGKYAFYGCDLTSVTIQNEQLNIGSNAFASNDCNNIFCSSKTPPTECNISAFSNSMLMYSTLNIPLGTKSAYESVDPWRNFWNIVEKDFSDVEEIIIEESEYISVCVNGGEIVINNALNCDVTVYSLTGQPIYCNNEYNGESISLSKGIYIVKAGGKTRKVII